MATKRLHHDGERWVREKRPIFSVGGLICLVALLTLVVGIALPGLLRARIASNETSAIGTLRTLYTSQAGFQSAAMVDLNGDGTGEFGWLQELAGATPYREPGGQLSATPTSPAFITSILGTTALAHGGIAGKSGTSFLVYLPTRKGAVAESAPFVLTTAADADLQELAFTCYAFPTSLGHSGNRAFVVNQQYEVYATANWGAQEYRGGSGGRANLPEADAAMVPVDSRVPWGSLPREFPVYVWSAEHGQERQLRTLEGERGDGHRWVPAGN